jgi:hypothetical protein
MPDDDRPFVATQIELVEIERLRDTEGGPLEDHEQRS